MATIVGAGARAVRCGRISLGLVVLLVSGCADRHHADPIDLPGSMCVLASASEWSSGATTHETTFQLLDWCRPSSDPLVDALVGVLRSEGYTLTYADEIGTKHFKGESQGASVLPARRFEPTELEPPEVVRLARAARSASGQAVVLVVLS